MVLSLTILKSKLKELNVTSIIPLVGLYICTTIQTLEVAGIDILLSISKI